MNGEKFIFKFFGSGIIFLKIFFELKLNHFFRSMSFNLIAKGCRLGLFRFSCVWDFLVIEDSRRNEGMKGDLIGNAALSFWFMRRKLKFISTQQNFWYMFDVINYNYDFNLIVFIVIMTLLMFYDEFFYTRNINQCWKLLWITFPLLFNVH